MRHSGGWATKRHFVKLVHASIAPRDLPLPYLFFPSLLYTIIFFHGQRRKKEVGNPGSLNLERTINDVLAARARAARSFYDSRLEDPVRGKRPAVCPRWCIDTPWSHYKAHENTSVLIFILIVFFNRFHNDVTSN